jgi:predicted MPP superfamily phosphohydrolase
MTDIALSGALGAAEPVSVVGSPAGGTREAWFDRRRAMERSARCVNPTGSHGDWEGRLLGVVVRAFGVALRPIGLYTRGRDNALAPLLVERLFYFPDLPAAFDGYRILHISDSHLDCLPELAGVARELISGLTVDLVAVTGDIQGAPRAPAARATLPLANVLGGLKVRDHTLAVLGNHDPATMAEALEHFGIATLINESLTIERGGERLVVTGLDDVHRFYTPAAKAALIAAPQGFRIALVHSPEVADHAAAAGFQLYLCGHTHGGQICLPSGRSIFTRLRRCHFGAQGEWRAGTMIGYTSNGLGVGEVPLRFNCRGEIAVITLRRGPAGD